MSVVMGNIQVIQGQMKKIIEDQKNTLEVLKNFNEKLEGSEEIEGIDEMLISLAKKEADLETFMAYMDKLPKDLEKSSEENNEYKALLEKLSNTEHIIDMDKLWETTNSNKSDLDELKKWQKQADRNLEEQRKTFALHEASIKSFMTSKDRPGGPSAKNLENLIVKNEDNAKMIAELSKLTNRLARDLSSSEKDIRDLRNLRGQPAKEQTTKEDNDIKLAIENTVNELKELKAKNKEIIEVQNKTQERLKAFEAALAAPKKVEGLDDKFKSIAKGHEDLNRELKQVKDNFEKQRTGIDELKKKLEEIEKKEPLVDNKEDKQKLEEISRLNNQKLEEISKLSEKKLDEISKLSNQKLDEISKLNAKSLEGLTGKEEIIKSLENYKNELFNLNHLFDVDKMWELLKNQTINFENFKEDLNRELKQVKDNFEKQRTGIDELKKKLEEIEKKEPLVDNKEDKQKLEEISRLNNQKLEEISKLSEKKLDEISKLSNQKLDEISKLNAKSLEGLTGKEEIIKSLENYKNELSNLNHLFDVDKMWELLKNQTINFENFKVDYESNKVDGEAKDGGEDINQDTLFEKIDGIQNSIQQNDLYTKSRLTNVEETTKLAIEGFEKKLQNAYIFGGIAVLIVVIQFIVIFFNMF